MRPLPTDYRRLRAEYHFAELEIRGAALESGEMVHALLDPNSVEPPRVLKSIKRLRRKFRRRSAGLLEMLDPNAKRNRETAMTHMDDVMAMEAADKSPIGAKLEKNDGLKNKLTAHLHKLDHHDLMALHSAISHELAKRAEKHSDAHPGRMTRDAFEKFAAKEIGKAADTAKRKKETTL